MLAAYKYTNISVGAGGSLAGGAVASPPRKKNREKFSGKYYVKFAYFVNFSAKYHVKFGNFVIFQANIMSNTDILLIFHIHIFGQKCLAPKVDCAAVLLYAYVHK